jgi:hypothetical protein
MFDRPRLCLRPRVALLIAALGVVALSGTALAHGGSLRSSPARSLSIPLWLFLATGGGVVGASFLLASFITDRELIRAVEEYRRSVTLSATVTRGLVMFGRAVGVVGLVAVVVVGLFGPRDPLANLGVLVVWVAWWAGFTMTTYTVGNTWPVLNPWRTLASFLPSLDRPYPDRLGAWPATVGLLALIWLEVVSPLADAPRLLAGVVLGYTIVTLGGAVYLGAERYFQRVDPVSRVFRFYGAVAPLYRNENGRIRFRLPGTGLESATLAGSRSEVAFVVALLWVTSYDGLVATPPWGDVLRPLVGLGVPAALLYPLALLTGFGLFLVLFRVAVGRGKEAAESYLDTELLARRFAPSLLAIAAGYHVAHYLGYFLELLPTLLATLTDPLSPPGPRALVLPVWFDGFELVFVLVGHVVAIWVAHAVAYDLFPSRMQAIRSQYALTAVMVFYTMTSLWIVSRPYAAPPFV